MARAYSGVLDGIVADEPVEGLPCLVTDTLMDDPERRRALAQKIVEFGKNLAR